MNQSNDHAAWLTILFGWFCGIAGHVTLSNAALCVSIAVGVLQFYKTWRDIQRSKGKP